MRARSIRAGSRLSFNQALGQPKSHAKAGKLRPAALRLRTHMAVIRSSAQSADTAGAPFFHDLHRCRAAALRSGAPVNASEHSLCRAFAAATLDAHIKYTGSTVQTPSHAGVFFWRFMGDYGHALCAFLKGILLSDCSTQRIRSARRRGRRRICSSRRPAGRAQH